MKREIRFRVWNGQKMVYDITVGKFGVFYVNPEKGDGLNPLDTASLTTNTTKYSDGTPLMQFTGIKVKDGKEIYDGDIIRYVNKIYVIQYDDRMCAWVVMYPTKDVIFRHGFWINNLKKNVLIIGNIYENPELLKSK